MRLCSRSAAMGSHKSPGFVLRTLRTLGAALKRGILNKSAHAYMKQFTGSAEYWDKVIAAQQGWTQKQLPTPDPERFRSRLLDNIQVSNAMAKGADNLGTSFTITAKDHDGTDSATRATPRHAAAQT